MHIPVSIRTSNAMADIKALVDSGATDCFMSESFVRRMKLGKRPLQKPRKIWNIDNTANRAGAITHYITLNIQTNGDRKQIQFLVTDIGNEDIILGYPWMAAFEPQFSWKNGVINERALPIILRSVNPHIPGKDPIIAQIKEDCHLRATTSTELAIKAHQNTQKVEVPTEYQQFAKLFSEEESKRYPPKRAWDHAIEFKKDAPEAVDCKVYPMNRIEDDAVQKFLDSELEKGYICESKSPYASSFFFVKKKDGKLRPVQDYRKINALTIRNQYPLPLIADLIRDLSNAHIYTKLDVRWGYNNVRIREGDEHKAAFKTRYGLFEPTVMYFGLTNSPVTFQTMMNFIYRDVILKHEPLGTTIRIYMDDIGIATRTNLTDHHHAVHDVLRVAQLHDLYFKPEKCLFDSPSMDYLGVILEKGVMRMDPAKIAGVDTWPVPTTPTALLSFLPPSSHMSDSFSYIASAFRFASTTIEQRLNTGGDLQGLRAALRNVFTVADSTLGDVSLLEFLDLHPTPPSSAPPTAPSLPQEELRLLRTSFDSAFALLAGQVKVLADKVNGSGPPPKVAIAKKPSAQPTPKPRAQPPTAPAPTPASRPAPPSFASVAKTPAQPLLVVALRSSALGGDVPLAICRSPQEVVTHLNTELADASHPVTLSAAQWTAKNNLVVTAGPDTLAYQLTQASHLISDILSTYLSHDSSPLPITTCDNVKWSHLLINSIPTGATSTHVPYSPSECLQALVADNPPSGPCTSCSPHLG